MTNTTYYNLNIVEGTDIVNPLIVDNPNYEKIDETMHNNAVSGVTLATEIANATVHAITRENSECAVIRFIATSNWKAGDTITVDGVSVTALLPSGETLPDGAYVINSNVLCILTGTNLTVYAERKKIDNANEIRYNNTNVGAELNKINSNLLANIFKQNSDPNRIELKSGGYLIFANAFANDTTSLITGILSVGNKIIAKATSVGSEGLSFYGGISLSDYAYISDTTTISFDTYCNGSIASKNVTAIKILN